MRFVRQLALAMMFTSVSACAVDGPEAEEDLDAEDAPPLSATQRTYLVALSPASITNLTATAESQVKRAQIGATLGDFDGDRHNDVLNFTSTSVTITFASGQVYNMPPPSPTMTITKVVPIALGTSGLSSFMVSGYQKTSDFYTREPQLMIVQTSAHALTVKTLAIDIIGRDVTCTKVPMHPTRGVCMFASYGKDGRTYSTLVQVNELGGVVDVTRAKGLPWNGAGGTSVSDDKYVNGKYMMGFAFVDLNGDGLPDLVGGGQHSQLMYSFMLRDGESYRFGPAAWFDDNDEYLGVSALGKSFYDFPCVYVQVEEEGNHPRGDFITCFDKAARRWTPQVMPARMSTGEPIERYVKGSREAKIVDSAESIYITTRVRLTTGAMSDVAIRVREWPGTAPLIQPYLRSEVFNPSYYAAVYPDLVRVFGNDAERLTSHWITHGLREGRKASSGFWSRVYLQRYPDLANAYGKDYARAVSHYVNHGLREGRSGASQIASQTTVADGIEWSELAD